MKEYQKQKSVIAIVPAAGLGKRFGPEKNKPFQILGGKPLIIWSLEILESVDTIDEIIPVLKGEDMESGQKVFKEYSISKIKRIATGGKERQDSVYNGLQIVDNKNSIVLIHDGARPLIEKDLLEKALKEFYEVIEGGEKIDGIILGVPVKDTVKETENSIVRKTLKRSFLWAIQTPQIFRYNTIVNVYEKASRDGFYATDDAALVEQYGGKIKVIMGSYKNIKITTPEDLAIAEALLKTP
jgi:2-C-methyl-D-erythritol 4-phosphate cytidylyltransferase